MRCTELCEVKSTQKRQQVFAQGAGDAAVRELEDRLALRTLCRQTRYPRVIEVTVRATTPSRTWLRSW